MSISESEPLFSCCGCRDDYSWPASDLRVYANELWCEPCWGETDMAHDGVHWAELTAFVPKQDAQIERLTKERDELAASHARLRDALDAAISYVLSIQMNIKYNLPIDGPKVDLPQLIIGVARKALAETPAQSVAHYKAEGLLMAADVCHGADKSEHSSDLGAKLEALAKEVRSGD